MSGWLMLAEKYAWVSLFWKSLLIAVVMGLALVTSLGLHVLELKLWLKLFSSCKSNTTITNVHLSVCPLLKNTNSLKTIIPHNHHPHHYNHHQHITNITTTNTNTFTTSFASSNTTTFIPLSPPSSHHHLVDKISKYIL